MRIREIAPVVAGAALVLCPVMLAQAPGTCAGMYSGTAHQPERIRSLSRHYQPLEHQHRECAGGSQLGKHD